MWDYEKVKERIKKLQIAWVIVVGEITLTVWTYYVYVWLVCVQTSQRWVETIILLSIYHLIFLLGLWCYVRTLTTPRKPVPPEFRLDTGSWQQLELDLSLQKATRDSLGIRTTHSNRGLMNTLNYCYLCGSLKPDRCHHCSRCKACVLRMDHHCPWINRCVGFHNHKFFILFLHYVFVYGVFIIITCSGVLPRVWRRDYVDKPTREPWTSPATPMTFTTAGHPLSEKSAAESAVIASSASASSSSATSTTGTGASLVVGTGLSSAFLQILVVVVIYLTIILNLLRMFHMHARLLDGNITTLEYSRPVGLPGGPFNTKTFDLGSVSANHEEIMGPRRLLWPFPVFTTLGDGVRFPVWDSRNGCLIGGRDDKTRG